MQERDDGSAERGGRLLHDPDQLLDDRLLNQESPLPPSFSVARAGFVLRSEPSLNVRLDDASRLFSGEIPEECLDLDVRWGDLSSIRREEATFDSGGCWALRRDGGSLIFDVYSPLFGTTPFRSVRLDREMRRGEIVLERSHFRDAQGVDPLGFPLAELLINQRLARAGGVEFHGCGIRTEGGRGLLFAGHSGDGKTTTAKVWEGRPGVTILSDDRIIVRSDITPGSLQQNSPLPLRERSVRRSRPFPHPARLGARPSPSGGEGANRAGEGGPGEGWLVNGSQGFRIYGTPWHGEGQFAANADAPLSAIFLLERGERTAAYPVAGANAVTALFARAFPPFYDAEAIDAVLETIDRLVDSIPVYRLAFVPDDSAIETALRIVGAVPS